jgi:deazaflavin-dependent oxidoreductase (nitroreductase family)
MLHWLARNPISYRLLLRYHRLVPAIEKFVRQVTGGRVGMMDLAGLPAIQVTVPGRQTGRLRTTTLQYVADGGRLLVVGSNWAKPEHPAWSANLAAAQRIEVRRGTERFTANAKLLVGADRDRAWQAILTHWPNYGIAQSQVPERPFRIFALTTS